MIGLMGMLVSCVFSVSARNHPILFFVLVCFPVPGRGGDMCFYFCFPRAEEPQKDLST